MRRARIRVQLEEPSHTGQGPYGMATYVCGVALLVAAGTPDMTRAGPVDELIAKTPDWRGAMLGKLRKIVHDADPEIAEDVKWKRPSNPLGSAVWSHGGMVCVGIILKERVRLAFSAGSSLPDPKKLFNAQLSGKSRAIDVSQNEKLDEQALKAIVKAAVGHNLAKTRPAKTRARSRRTK